MLAAAAVSVALLMHLIWLLDKTMGRRKRRRSFAAPPFQCEICLEDMPGGERADLSCGHGFCRGCMTQFIETKVKDGALRICCPSAGCHHELQTEEVVSGLTRQLRGQYRSSVAQARRRSSSRAADEAMGGLLKSNQVRRCPHCGHGVEKRDGCDHMTCRCGADFCWLCGADYNGP